MSLLLSLQSLRVDAIRHQVRLCFLESELEMTSTVFITSFDQLLDLDLASLL